MRTLFKISSIAITMSLLSVASLAGAASPGRPSEVVVKAPAAVGENQRPVPVWDLALNSPKGQKALVQRLRFAIASLCVDLGGSFDPTYSLKCSNAAWQSVRPQLAEIAR